MDLQYFIVIAIILAASIFAGRALVQKRRDFSTKRGCANDFGCHK